ncbi:ARID domain-containing protein [Rhizoctonia solani]|uniref:ARID domain-containing protein n=1 Tax=Rhizoctonia solani TaxID=456999 RepID=A0A8H8NSW6_9AGAM|nr:ARID domain-containing protein [Rhizoctonia solani]QRW17753.1 ARID domain-containing protein [Rhizoctonia solani]
MGDPLNNPFGQQNIYRHLQSQGLAMDNPAGVPQAPPSLAPAIPSMPGGVQDPNQAKLWKAIGEPHFIRCNAHGRPLHFFILLAFISLFLSFSLSHPIPNSHPSCIPLPSPLSTPFPPGHPTTIALRLLLMPRGVCVDGPFSLNWAASTATLDSLPRNLPVFATILTPDFRPQFLQNLAHMQPGQGGYRGNNTMALASGPQAGQPNLVQGNPTAQQQFLQQQSIQRLGLGLGQQQQQQQLGAAIQHPGLGNANHLNLTQGNNPALMSLMGMQGNAIGQLNNQIMNLRNPNVLEMQHRLDPGMNDQLQAIQRAQGGLNRPGLAQGGPGAATNQHIRLPGDGHNSPLLPAHDQNPMVGGLNRSPQPGNQPHQPNMPQTNPGVALIHKLDSLPIRDLEARVAAWRDNLPALENRVQELLNLANRQPEMMPAYSRSKQELEQNKFLYIKSQEILNRKHIAQSQMAQAQAQQAQAHAQAQAQNRMTPTLGEPVRPGSRAAGTMPGQVPGMTGWQQPGPSTTPQLPQGSPPGPSTTPFQPVPSPQPNLDQANQVRAAMNQNGTPRQSVIPRDRAAFVQFMRMWFVQTGRTSDAIPKIGDKPLDLHQLYVEVETWEGWTRWEGLLAQIAKVLADAYVALLVPFDNFCLERMRAVGNGIQNNRINLGLGQPAIGMTPGGLRPGPGGVLPGGDGMSPMANFQRILAFLQVSLKDWMPELPAQAKLLRASQMDVPEMQRQGWPPERITAIQRFRPALMQYRATLMRQQELQRLSQQGQQQQIAQAQVHQQQLAQQQQQNQQSHLNDHRSSIGGGSLPPNMQAHNLGMPGGLKLPFSPEATSRAKVIVENIAREIEHSRQYQRREVLDSQRVQMNQTVVASHPFAVEFERTVSLYFLLFNNHPQTRALMEQASRNFI